jgi:hypothetical protein
LGLDRVFTDVEGASEFAVRHSGRQQRQELALASGEEDASPRPLQRFVDSALRPSGVNDALTLGSKLYSIDDLLSWYCLRNEPLSSSPYRTAHHMRLIGKTEDDDCSVARVDMKSPHSVAKASVLSVRVEQRHVDTSPRPLPDIHLDDPDVWLAEPEQGAQALEDDHVVVDERYSDRFRHGFTLWIEHQTTITRSGDCVKRRLRPR